VSRMSNQRQYSTMEQYIEYKNEETWQHFLRKKCGQCKMMSLLRTSLPVEAEGAFTAACVLSYKIPLMTRCNRQRCGHVIVVLVFVTLSNIGIFIIHVGCLHSYRQSW